MSFIKINIKKDNLADNKYVRKSTNRHILEIPERHNILWVFAIIYDWTNFLVYICCKKFENCFSGSIESYAIVGNAHLKIGCQSMNAKVWMQKLPKYKWSNFGMFILTFVCALTKLNSFGQIKVSLKQLFIWNYQRLIAIKL